MTWSIVARSKSGAFGVAIASRFFAVGALCPHAHSGIGALATQALVNPQYGPRGLTMLSQGLSAADVVYALTDADGGRQHRQLHVIDAEGNIAAHTGVECIDWCGQVTGVDFSVAGNMLAGPQVIEDTAQAYDAGSDLPFAERLIAAMEAGEAAGGDKRGKQAAALLICAAESYPFLDLRVDDHPDPLSELLRLYVKSLERYQPFVACLPSRARPAGLTDRAQIEMEVERFHAAAHKRAHRPS
ncbi:MAG: DUF1028 domain-containing protein [Betaproteobacteria bacterium]